MFKVEDGTGYEDSTSYVEITYADDFISLYYPNDTDWSSKSVAEKELALINATRFVDGMVKWNAEIFKTTQALKWPRTEFKDVDGRTIQEGTIPSKIKDAVVTMALESLTADIYAEGVLINSQKYGSSSETYSGPVRDGGNMAAMRIIRDLKMYGYGTSKFSMVTVQRA